MRYKIKSKKHHEDNGRELYHELFEKEASVLGGALTGAFLGGVTGAVALTEGSTGGAATRATDLVIASAPQAAYISFCF